MASTTQLDHRSMVLSLEEEVGYDPELDEAIHLGDVLTCEKDDPSMAAGRNRDWEEFLESHDYRYGVVVSDLASGRTMIESAKTCGMTYHGIREVRGQLAEDLQEFMGSTVIADSVKIPGWRGNIMADKERMACRADRRRG